MSEQARTTLTSKDILAALKAGNTRFVSNVMTTRDNIQQVARCAQGQQPIAVVLSCMDSRVPVETIFDQGLGDVFSVRVAGNVLNDDVLASMEFACLLSTARLIVVVGHSSCGAVQGACDGAQLEHLTGLLEKLQPAIETVAATRQGRDAEFVQQVAVENAKNVVAQVRASSYSLEAAISRGEVGIVDAIYSVQSGSVVFGELQ